MTDSALYALFSHEYDANGMPVIELEKPEPMTEHQQVERHCFLNCITDPVEVEREWKKWKASQKCGQ